jgi:phage-related protein
MVDFRVSGRAELNPDEILESVDRIIEKLDELKDKISEVDADIDRLSTKSVDIDVQIHGQDKLDELRILLDEIDAREYVVNLRVDVRDEDKLEDLKLKLDEIDKIPKTVDVKVNVNGAARSVTELEALDKELNNKQKDLKKTSDATKEFQFSIMALLPVFTAIIPILASAGAGVIALAGAFAVMAPGILGIALAAKPAFTEIQNLTKSLDQNTQNALANARGYAQIYNILDKNSTQFRQMSGEMQDLTVKWFELKNAYTAFQKAVDPAVLPLLGQGMDLLRKLLSGLPALVRPAAAALQSWLDDFSTRLHDPVFRSFFHDMTSNMYTLVSDWSGGITNIIEGLAALFHAFMPITVDMSGGFLRMTESFDKWAQSLSKSKGFQQFIDYVKKEGPVALHVIGQLVELLFKIAGALTGMGAGALGVIDRIVTGLNHFADTNPGLFKVGVNIGIIGIAAAKLGPMLGPLIEFLATPVGAIVGVLVAVGAAFVYLYTHSKEFHDWVIKNLGPMWNQLVQDAQGFVKWAKGIWPEIKQIWDKYGKQIEAIVKDDFGWIVSIIEAAMKLIKGIIDTVLGLLSGNWSQVWKGIKETASAVWDAIYSTVKHGVELVIDHFKLFNKFMMSLAQSGANDLRKVWDEGMATLERLIKEGFDTIVAGAKQWGTDFLNGLSNAWGAVENFFKSIPGRIKQFFANAGSWLLQAGKDLISGLMGGISGSMGDLFGLLGSVASGILSHKGPPEKDRVLLFNAGQLIMQGFMNGIKSQEDRLNGILTGYTKTIANTFGSQYTTDISTRVQASLADANFAVGSFGRGGSLPSAGPTNVTFAAGAIQVNNPKPEQPGVTLTRVMQGLSTFGSVQAPTGARTR